MLTLHLLQWQPEPGKLSCTAAWLTHDQVPHSVNSTSICSQVESDMTRTSIHVEQLDDANHLLHVYRREFRPWFPFVVVPDKIQAQEFQDQKPWLIRAITMVAFYHNHPKQIVLAQTLLKDTSEAMLIRGERSIDMLQAMIVYNAWSVL